MQTTTKTEQAISTPRHNPDVDSLMYNIAPALQIIASECTAANSNISSNALLMAICKIIAFEVLMAPMSAHEVMELSIYKEQERQARI